MKTRKILLIGVLLLTAHIMLFNTLNVYAGNITTLSPNRGKVGDTINLTGSVTPNGSWIILFDANGNGDLVIGEQVASGQAGDAGAVSATFTVPSCFGSDSGLNHLVGLLDINAPIAITAYPPPPDLSIVNFPVVTSRTLTMPPSVSLGDVIPIYLSLSGGQNSTTYRYNIQVTKPDGTTSNAGLTAYTNPAGEASATITYPDSFPQGQKTNQIGSYTILVIETTQSNTNTLSGTTTVQGEPNNNQPIATITSIQPNPATEGATVTFMGFGTAASGHTITNYRWTSSITGEIGSTSTFSTDTLPMGIHTVTFEVQDDKDTWSEPDTETLEVTDSNGSSNLTSPSATPSFEERVPIMIGGLMVACIALLSTAMVWMHYNNLTTEKIKNKLNGKKAQEDRKEQDERKKDENENQRQKIKQIKKPYLAFDANVPSYIMKETVYGAILHIKNIGTADATDIQIEATENPFVEFQNPTIQIPNLTPGKSESTYMTFVTNHEIRKNIYQMRFQAISAQTSTKTKNCFMRGGRIALLSDPKKPQTADPIRAWLQKNNYPCQDMHNADHLMTELYNYDLIIVAPDQEMPAKWVQNLCTYVENSQSILLIDKITTSKPELMNETLGYSQVAYQPLDHIQAVLEICGGHPITKGFNIGEKIALGACTGNACIFTNTTATVLANNIYQNGQIKEERPIPAITATGSGKGKIVHLNFYAQTHLDQIESLLKNAIDWLLLY